ncbi:MAG TPA: transcriptional regulator [Cyanobacteria bacterium UBA11149]|nr:transcriptional regulator [Cyanobacteria bacterium UBA11367]HBE58758.1 transcriptional regulator [Cyanobacteria bacterium UBA11366]HBK63724.1 transcriptional regulator [Cyanobacteria bacterium UBA11166]HBR73252.1 transcriptional regulator [Cyanobacteria bacterium UBA11159]HBS68807.1 transcriptional regulator [Cyanobacteria bacterium UBA11153]HBW92443.1 transcriptional regulator [Cyanobacteria bacterium UBA11149]HCA97482.1 transcriptional regulator [Cyanobacteria bacterium UBA9226]
MPEISRFFGIIISMYYNDHPPPHFHVRYGKQKAIVSIVTVSVLEGQLSSRVFGLVREWAKLHQTELLENWERARENNSLEKIEPLE